MLTLEEAQFTVDSVYAQPGGKIVRYLVWSPTSRRIWVDVNELGKKLVFDEHSFSRPLMTDDERIANKAGALAAVDEYMRSHL